MLSVLLTTHNSEKFLAEQLDSLALQTLGEFELLVSDDCSVDSTLKILAKYKPRFYKMTVFTHAEPLGFVRNFEFLMTKVESEYFALCDHDDVWLPDKLERCLNKLMEKDCALSYCDLAVTDEKLNVKSISMQRLNNSVSKTKFSDLSAVFLYNIVTGCTIVAKSSIIPLALPIPDGITHDWWLSLIAAQSGGICYVDEPLILYRQHEGNEIGAKSAAQKSSTFDEYRKNYLDFKINQFSLYAKSLKLPCEFEELSALALGYYTALRDVRRFSLRRIKDFRKIYQKERFKRRAFSLFMLHMPCLIRPFFAPR